MTTICLWSYICRRFERFLAKTCIFSNKCCTFAPHLKTRLKNEDNNHQHTDKELGYKLSDMGYEHKKQTKGASYRMKEK